MHFTWKILINFTNEILIALIEIILGCKKYEVLPIVIRKTTT